MTRISALLQFAVLAATPALIVCPAYAQGQAPAQQQSLLPAAPAPNASMPAMPGGCYQITEHVYGPYTMRFCLTEPGTYQVTGNSLTCNGSLAWRMSGNDLAIQLHRGACGGGRGWSADQISCQSTGMFGGRAYSRAMINSGVPTLHCTYTPASAALKPATVRAKPVG
jgi:hypothetical protein